MSAQQPAPHYLFEDERKLWTEAAAVGKKNWQIGTAGHRDVVSCYGGDIGPVAIATTDDYRNHIAASHPAAVMTLLERLSALRERHALAVGYGLPPNAVPDFTQLEILLREEKARCNDTRIDYDKADTVAVVKKWLAQYAAAPSVEATKTEALDKLEERFQNIARAQATTHSDYVASMATVRAELLLRLTQRDEEIRHLQEERTQLAEQHAAALKELRDEIEAHALELGRVREQRDNAYRDVRTQQERIEKLAAEIKEAPSPIPMRLPCPGTVERDGIQVPCGALHIDEGEFATKPHHTHTCQACGMVWRPAIVNTVGVHFLPGYKNPEPPEEVMTFETFLKLSTKPEGEK